MGLNLVLHRRLTNAAAAAWVLGLGWSPAAQPPNALEAYVAQPDAHYAWRQLDQQRSNGLTLVRLELTSQRWREHLWQHPMLVVRPDTVRHPDIAFLLVSGDGRPTQAFGLLRTLAERAGAVAAVLTRVPNQPLYEGRKEDALIAYTFDQYAKTGDPTWPLLFPMVKSAVRALDALQQWAQAQHGQRLSRFVVGGASKRGWTTWLTAAVDRRVCGLAPMVFDMLNMKVQTDWAQKVYGRQSEQIHDYVDLGLVEKLDSPPLARLRSWVDPYSYCKRYTQPKLILLGSNDPYWTVDALRHYWPDLPEPKLVYQTPNAGHDLGGGAEATQTLAAFFHMLADRQPLPRLQWRFADPGRGVATLRVSLDRPAQAFCLWTADSSDRDFRDEVWRSRPLEPAANRRRVVTQVQTPAAGYRAYFVEALLADASGRPYRLSTEARVTPDTLR